MPTKDDGITKRKDGRYMVRYSVHCPGEPKWIFIYGRRPKRRRVAEALGVEPH
jgi:hypothetical protein